MEYDNVVNMDTRTVISGIQFGSFSPEQIESYKRSNVFQKEHSEFQPYLLTSLFDNTRAQNTTDEIISWITRLKTTYELDVERIPLNQVQRWHKDDYEIYHETRNYFSVIAVLVEIGNREVKAWSQPLVRHTEGIILFCKKLAGSIISLFRLNDRQF
jgi:oxidase EvaA